MYAPYNRDSIHLKQKVTDPKGHKQTKKNQTNYSGES